MAAAFDRTKASLPTAFAFGASVSNDVFFPSSDERRRYEDQLTTLLLDATRRVSAGPVTPTVDMDAFRAELAAFDFEQTVALEGALRWAIVQLEAGVVHTNHQRYLGLFNPAATFPAQCADRIAATFNPQLATATTSPVAVAIEQHVIRAVGQRAGLGRQVGGHFTSGGSEANYTALICALTRAEPGFATSGGRAFRGQPVFYAAKDSHLAWIKIAHQAGIGRDAVRLVATDGTGRMSVNALAAAIDDDLACGKVPCMIVATAGTTNAGMIDPLSACGEVARRNGMWFHVDAAWGGALIASSRLRGLLAGIEQADSITIDAHKWFAVTMGCGMFLTRDPSVLSAAFDVSASYMPSHNASADPYVTSVQWSRRFLGLRLFLSLAVGGWAGYADHVEHAVELAQRLARRAVEHGWRVVNEPLLAVVCIEPPHGPVAVRDIVRAVLASGDAWVSAAVFEGNDVIRACVTQGQTTLSDIDFVMERLESARRKAFH
jgi:aromatic-L-amino-acid decarboxylase